MKFNQLILFCCFLGLSSIAWSQKNAILKGTISDAANKEALIGANVKAGNQGTATNFEGNYKLELPAGQYMVEFSFVSYKTQKREITLKAGEELVLDIQLGENETLLNTATVTSSKFEKPLGEVTVSMEVVRPALIENTNAVAINEVLDKLPGINMMEDQVDIRGGAGYAQGTGSRVLMLMDDLPIMQVDAGLPQWRDIPTENISQIEVVKGAASALYGSAAMNGIINIRTAYPTSTPVTKVSLSGKTFMNPKDSVNQWWNNSNRPYESNLQVSHRQKIGKFDIVAGTNLYIDQSFMRGSDRDTTGGIDTLQNYVRAGRMTFNTRYRVNDKLFFGLNTNLNVGGQNRHLFWRTNNGSLYEADPLSIPIRGKYVRFTVDPSMTYFDKSGARHRVQSRYFFIDNNNENKQSNASNYIYAEYQYQRKFEKLQGLELASGVVGSYSHVVAEVYGDNAFDLGNFAAYAQVEKKFFERLSISLGFRYEVNALNSPDSVNFGSFGRKVPAPDTVEGRPILRFGANYRLLEGTFMRMSFGQAYRFPTLVEKYVSTSAGSLGVYPNPQLKSETGWSAELGIKQGFKVGNWQGFLDAAAFWTEYENMMEFLFQQSLFGFSVQNIGNTRIRGFETSVLGQGKLGDVSIDLIAGYTYLDPRFRGDSSEVAYQQNLSSNDSINVLKYRSRHSAKIDAQLSYKGFAIGATVQYMSFMQAIDRGLENLFPTMRSFRAREDVQNGTFLLNARLAYTYKFAKLSLVGQNLLNTEYSVRPGRLEAPRNVALRLDFTFAGKEKK